MYPSMCVLSLPQSRYEWNQPPLTSQQSSSSPCVRATTAVGHHHRPPTPHWAWHWSVLLTLTLPPTLLFYSVKHLCPPFSHDFSSSKPFFLVSGRQRLPTKPGWVREATWLEGRKVKAKGCTGTADSVCVCVCVCVSQWKCVALKYLRKLLLLLRLLSLFWLTHCWTSGTVN